MAETVALKPAKLPVRGLVALATAFGLGAVTAAAACCVLPLALASIGVGAGLAGGFAILAGVRTPLLATGAAVLALAWIVWWRRRETACAPNDVCATRAWLRGSLALLIISTALVALAGVFPMLEPTLMKWAS